MLNSSNASIVTCVYIACAPSQFRKTDSICEATQSNYCNYCQQSAHLSLSWAETHFFKRKSFIRFNSEGYLEGRTLGIDDERKMVSFRLSTKFIFIRSQRCPHNKHLLELHSLGYDLLNVIRHSRQQLAHFGPCHELFLPFRSFLRGFLLFHVLFASRRKKLCITGLLWLCGFSFILFCTKFGSEIESNENRPKQGLTAATHLVLRSGLLYWGSPSRKGAASEDAQVCERLLLWIIFEGVRSARTYSEANHGE